jgi:hypothetical protein
LLIFKNVFDLVLPLVELVHGQLEALLVLHLEGLLFQRTAEITGDDAINLQ